MSGHDPLEGDDRFELLGELGRGGMGVVYRARDRQTGREVALKVVLSRLSETRLRRFQREGELTARLQHPAIVRIFSSGDLGGRPYLAYELVEGDALGDVLPRVGRRRRIELICEAARGLGYAHAQGVTHRDVKPDNILVGLDGQLRVADFGLATARDVERLTKTGASMGTPTHMSPEQIGGASGAIGPTADTWALGVILYEALTDRLPFAAAENMIELAGQIISTRVVAPRAIDPSVPEDLERICLKALAKAPALRYPTGTEFAEDLQRHLQGEAVGARVERSGTLASRVAGAAVVLAGVALVVLSSLSTSEEQTAASPPPAPPEERRAVDGTTHSSGVELDRLLALPGEPQPRHAGLVRWLSEHPEHPEASRAAAARDALQREFPVWSVELRQGRGRLVHARFLDDRRVLTFVRGTPLRGWSRDDPSAPLWSIDLGGASVQDLVVAPGGAAAIVGLAGAPPLRVDLGSREASPLEGISVPFAEEMTFSADGGRLALCGAKDGNAYVYSWPEREELFRLPRGAIRDLALSADGRLLAVCGGGWLDQQFARRSADGDFLEVWDVDAQAPLLRETFRAPPKELCFSPDQRYVVAGDTVGALFAYELARPEARILFRDSRARGAGNETYLSSVAHTGEIEGVVFLPDGVTLVSSASQRTGGAGDSELKLWSFPGGALLRVMPRPTRPVGLELSPSKRFLLTGGEGAVEVHLAER